ncbi:hypothetical protein AOLI_G00137490 [Acnodon oligacanthus]
MRKTSLFGLIALGGLEKKHGHPETEKRREERKGQQNVLVPFSGFVAQRGEENTWPCRETEPQKQHNNLAVQPQSSQKSPSSSVLPRRGDVWRQVERNGVSGAQEEHRSRLSTLFTGASRSARSLDAPRGKVHVSVRKTSGERGRKRSEKRRDATVFVQGLGGGGKRGLGSAKPMTQSPKKQQTTPPLQPAPLLPAHLHCTSTHTLVVSV